MITFLDSFQAKDTGTNATQCSEGEGEGGEKGVSHLRHHRQHLHNHRQHLQRPDRCQFWHKLHPLP